MFKLPIEPADVRPTVANWIVVGLMAVTFFVVFKVLAQKFPVKGVSTIAQAI